MDRRNFLKAGAALGAGAMVLPGLRNRFATAAKAGADAGLSYGVGEVISPDVFVLDGESKRHNLLDLVANDSSAAVHLLYLFGGGALGHGSKLGGIWCEDSFEDLQVLRYIQEKYEFAPLNIITVACAPIYSTQYYGLAEGVFLNESDSSEKYQEAARKFIASTNESVESGFVPVQPYFDLRLRLLFNRREDLAPGADYGEVFDWQGKFRASDEEQKYGVPTIWLLNYEGKVLEPPFHGNVYHSEPYAINYTLLDVDRAVQRHLE